MYMEYRSYGYIFRREAKETFSSSQPEKRAHVELNDKKPCQK